MGEEERPLILVSNDDGIRSAGLRALAAAWVGGGGRRGRSRPRAECDRPFADPDQAAPCHARGCEAGTAWTEPRPIASPWRSWNCCPASRSWSPQGSTTVRISETTSPTLERLRPPWKPRFRASRRSPFRWRETGVDFRAAAASARRLAREVLRRGLPQDTLLNVNVPNLPPDGIRGLGSHAAGASRLQRDASCARRIRGEGVLLDRRRFVYVASRRRNGL